MGAKILTGYTGDRHITPLDDAAVYRALIGSGMYILGEGDLCSAYMPSNNEFDIASGILSIQGVQVRIFADTLTVDNCPAGKVRKDLVVASWSHDTDTLIDSVQLAVIKGTEVNSGSTPTTPTYNSGDIANGATEVDMPLYEISLNGSTATFELVAEIIDGNIGEASVLTISIPSFSSLPQTVSDTRINSSHIVLDAVLSNPAAMMSSWTATTADGSITITGTISGSTSADVYLVVRR